jgi:hypothetical protein
MRVSKTENGDKLVYFNALNGEAVAETPLAVNPSIIQ